MSLLKIAWRSMQRRALSSILTGVSMAIGVALVVAVLVIHAVVENQFSRGAQGFHLIVGPKGGSLELVLNTIYHLGRSKEPIPYSFYQEFSDPKGKFAPYTQVAIPCCLGDSYLHGGQTFRVVGTTPDLFDKIEYDRDPNGVGHFYEFQEGGRNFQTENFYEAVIGSVVAAQTGLKVGEKFQPAHGIVEDEAQADLHDAFTIVGVLEPTGTPNDRALFVNIEGFYKLEGHAKPPEKKETAKNAGEKDSEAAPQPKLGPHDPLPEAQREVTSILVLLKPGLGDLYSQRLAAKINEGSIAQAVYPTAEVQQMFNSMVGPLQIVLLAITGMIVVVAAIGIMVSIYNSMNERGHEIAIMHALGAGRGTVMSVVLLESVLLSLLGGLGGILLGHAAIAIASPALAARTGVVLHFFQFSNYELPLIGLLMVLASLVGLLPAGVAYRTDVAKALSSAP